MGGTSTDVSRFGGDFERVYETETAGVRIRAPMLAIHTVAAGGGSLCRFDGHRLTVGPQSAGAVPGPLCYGHPDARELDADRRQPRAGPPRARPLPVRARRCARGARARAARRRRCARRATSAARPRSRRACAEIADANMAEAIRAVSVARGYDVRDHALIVFGGAGGQHACAVARRLGMRRIVFHPLAGVLSAYGMGLADVSWSGEQRPRLSGARCAAPRRARAACTRSSRRAGARRWPPRASRPSACARWRASTCATAAPSPRSRSSVAPGMRPARGVRGAAPPALRLRPARGRDRGGRWRASRSLGVQPPLEEPPRRFRRTAPVAAAPRAHVQRGRVPRRTFPCTRARLSRRRIRCAVRRWCSRTRARSRSTPASSCGSMRAAAS